MVMGDNIRDFVLVIGAGPVRIRKVQSFGSLRPSDSSALVLAASPLQQILGCNTSNYLRLYIDSEPKQRPNSLVYSSKASFPFPDLTHPAMAALRRPRRQHTTYTMTYWCRDRQKATLH